jgi:KUP system potassium uptake protein
MVAAFHIFCIYLLLTLTLVVGFYGVTYQLGYRDEFDVDINIVVNEICSLEQRVKAGADPRELEDAIREIKEAAKRTTHMPVQVLPIS